MQIPMTVFSVERSTREVEAMLKDGTRVPAKVSCTRVQLTPGEGDDHGTMTLSLVGPESDEAQALEVGQTVKVTVEAA